MENCELLFVQLGQATSFTIFRQIRGEMRLIASRNITFIPHNFMFCGYVNITLRASTGEKGPTFDSGV
jgi:hypothetical protein